MVADPNILLMDELFSALDVLTAETLRADFLDLWSEGQLPIKGVILVTHNIEEAVLMGDRVLCFGSNPGRILREIKVDLPHPRARLDPAFRDLVERVYVEMTTKAVAAPGGRRAERFAGTGIGTILPAVSSTLLSGLLKAVAAPPYGGKADLPVIAASLRLEIDDLFPVAETLQMLRLAELAGGGIRLTAEGRQFASLDTHQRKRLFARHLLSYVALAAHIRRVLGERPEHRAPWHRFAGELEDHMSPRAAEQTLRSVIDLGRYAEVFAYNDEKHVFSLDNP